MRKPLSILFVVLFISACGHLGNTNGGEGGGSIVGGSTTPPGNTGDQASSLINNPLSSICQTRGGTLYFGSNGGKLLTSTNGTSVTVLDGTARDIRGAFCEGASTTVTKVWFAGAAGLIFHYDGTTLTQQTSNTTKNLFSVFGANANDVFAVGETGTGLALNGVTWTPQPAPILTESLQGVSASDAAHFYVVGTNRKVFQLTPPSTWTQIPDGSLPPTADVPSDTQLNAIWADPASGNLFVVGNAGKIMKGTSLGTVWVAQASGTSLDLLAVHGTSNSNVFAVGKSGVILFYNGTAWTKQTVPTGTDAFQLNGVLATTTGAYAVGANGTSATSTGLILKLTSGIWAQVL